MNRIDQCFDALAKAEKKAVIPYVVAGDPTFDTTVPLLHAMVEAGADIIEIGVPFSDPMAEGPVIQLAHERALEHHVSLRDVLDMVAQFRQSDTKTPIVLMGYANPIENIGYQAFAQLASEAGVDAMLTVDLPPEEAVDLNTALKAHGIESIFLIAPTTTDQRIEKVCALAGGYIYYVSLKGVTGAGHLDIDDVARNVDRIKSHTALPVCVGFGIKDAESARLIAKCADGVVVGSVLVDIIHKAVEAQRDSSDNGAPQMQRIIANLTTALSEIASGANA